MFFFYTGLVLLACWINQATHHTEPQNHAGTTLESILAILSYALLLYTIHLQTKITPPQTTN